MEGIMGYGSKMGGKKKPKPMGGKKGK